MTLTIIAPLMIETTSIANERICIGVVVVNPTNIKHFIAPKKMKSLHFLLSSNEEKYVKKYIKKWGDDWEKFNQNTGLLNPALENFRSLLEKKWNVQNKNLSMYAEIYESSVEVEEHDFKELCISFTGESPAKKIKKKVVENKFKEHVKKLQSSLQFVSYQKNVVLKPENFEGLLSNYKVDLLDVEEKISAIQFLDLESSALLLERKVLRFDSFVKSLIGFNNAASYSTIGPFIMAYKTPRKESEKKIIEKLLQKRNLSFEFIPIGKVKERIKK